MPRCRSIRSCRAPRPWNVPIQWGAAVSPSAARMCPAISAAALLVKVTARIREAAMRRTAIRCATAAVRHLVLPVPAPARTRTGPVLVAASACDGVSPASIEAPGGVSRPVDIDMAIPSVTGQRLDVPTARAIQIVRRPDAAVGRGEFAQLAREQRGGEARRPRLPGRETRRSWQRIVREWVERNAQPSGWCATGRSQVLVGPGPRVGGEQIEPPP